MSYIIVIVLCFCFFLMIRLPPRSTRTDTLFPFTTLFLSVAILAANYLAQHLSGAFPVLYTGRNGRVAHECILDLRPLKAQTGISEEDVAKRLMDYRSEEHTSELQSLMRISYAVFCLTKKTN